LHKDLRRPAQSRVSRGGNPHRAGQAAQRECSASGHRRATAPCSVGLPHATPRALLELFSLVPDQAGGDSSELRDAGVLALTRAYGSRAACCAGVSKGAFGAHVDLLRALRGAAAAPDPRVRKRLSSGYAKADAMVDVAMAQTRQALFSP